MVDYFIISKNLLWFSMGLEDLIKFLKFGVRFLGVLLINASRCSIDLFLFS